jgi:septum formation protein
MKKYNLYLASNSPRRKELLQWSYLPFQVEVSGIDENSRFTEPHEYVMDLAFQKAQNVFHKLNLDNAFVIGADTTVVLDGEIINKPANQDEARKILKKLSAKTHTVYTGVSFIFKNEKGTITHNFFDKTYVTFSHINDDLLELYLNTGESLDKAGAYGIQGRALGFIEKLDGSYSNVVGFPLDKVIFNLKSILGYKTDETGLYRLHFDSPTPTSHRR